MRIYSFAATQCCNSQVINRSCINFITGQNEREETTQNTTVTWQKCCVEKMIFITGQNEREETTQNTTVTQSAACASYKSNYVTHITGTYTRAKRRRHGATAPLRLH
jgi:hypothetical protein